MTERNGRYIFELVYFLQPTSGSFACRTQLIRAATSRSKCCCEGSVEVRRNPAWKATAVGVTNDTGNLMKFALSEWGLTPSRHGPPAALRAQCSLIEHWSQGPPRSPPPASLTRARGALVTCAPFLAGGGHRKGRRRRRIPLARIHSGSRVHHVPRPRCGFLCTQPRHRGWCVVACYCTAGSPVTMSGRADSPRNAGASRVAVQGRLPEGHAPRRFLAPSRRRRSPAHAVDDEVVSINGYRG
jgi:hypothetical protein